MKQLLYLGLLTGCLSGCMFGTYSGGGTGYPTPSTDDTYGSAPSGSQPGANGRPASPGVQVLAIELTPQYTMLYMSYTDRDRPQYDPLTRRQQPNGTIQIEPAGYLVAANGARTFRFIKAEGIPVKPQSLPTYAGDKVDFVLYFERLDKGLEHFDLFECNDSDHVICWNMYDLFVTNPLDPAYRPDPGPAAPVPTAPQAPMPPAPADVTLSVTGTVRNARSNRPVSATIDYKLSGSPVSVDSVQSFASTGAYRLNLDRGQVYTYVASAPGYRVGTGTLDLSQATPGQKLIRDITLSPLAVGDKIELKNIYFEMSKSDLLSASFAELNQIVTMMQDNPRMTIRLEGHTDIIGDADKNLQLSKDRVWACRDYLVQQGIDRERIDAVGYGDTRPIRTTGTDAERRVNRRVEFVILTL